MRLSMNGRRSEGRRVPRLSRSRRSSLPTSGLVLLLLGVDPGGASAMEPQTTELAIDSEEPGLDVWLLDGPPGPAVLPSSDAARILCWTPCRLALPVGRYELRAGESHAFEFELADTPQGWFVADDSTAMWGWALAMDIIGAVLVGVGSFFVLASGIMDSPDTVTDGAVVTAVGGGLLLGSIPLWVLWQGDAQRVSWESADHPAALR
jgi:hypothetical protein